MNGEELREPIYEILIDVFNNYMPYCDEKCYYCDYSDRGKCGKLVDAMAKAIYDAGYRKNAKHDVTDKYVGGKEKGGAEG